MNPLRVLITNIGLAHRSGDVATQRDVGFLFLGQRRAGQVPFDRDHAIAESVQKTGALLVVDEDVPGGASAYIVREVVETQGAIDDLDVGPRTLTAATQHCITFSNAVDGFFGVALPPSPPWILSALTANGRPARV